MPCGLAHKEGVFDMSASTSHEKKIIFSLYSVIDVSK
jgi:hypothetical protein